MDQIGQDRQTMKIMEQFVLQLQQEMKSTKQEALELDIKEFIFTFIVSVFLFKELTLAFNSVAFFSWSAAVECIYVFERNCCQVTEWK
jgi:hypothetical protein